MEQGFELRFATKTVALDATGFSDISFRGEYPIGRVEYRSAAVPLTVTLEAFSPFIPHNTNDSSLPATILQFALTNTSPAPVEAVLVGRLENAVLLHHRTVVGTRCNRVLAGRDYTFLECAVEGAGAVGTAGEPVTEMHDFGTMGLALLGAAPEVCSGDERRPVAERLVGEIGRKLELAPGASAAVTFVLSWLFPNLELTGIRS